MAKSRWYPIDRTNKLSLISLNMYSRLLGVSDESLSSCTFCDSQCQLLTVNKTRRHYLYHINIHVVKKDQPHPNGTHWLLSQSINSMSHNISAQFIHQNFGKNSHQRIQHMAKLGIYTVLPTYIPKLYFPYMTILLTRDPALHINQMFLHTTLSWSLAPILNSVFNKIFYQKIPTT